MQNNFLTYFFNSLNNQDIKYCALRNYQQLPESTGSSDLDILIHENDIKKFFEVISTFIEKYRIKIVSIIESDQCPKYCLLSENWGIQIDVFKGGVFFGKKEIIKSEILFKNVKKHNTVFVLDSSVGALLSFLKEILNNKTCKEKYITELKQNFSSGTIEKQLFLQFKPEFHQHLNNRLSDLNSSHIKQFYSIARRSFSKRKYSGIFQKLRRLSHQPGYTIAFLGTDGSGKSTIIESIQPVLNDAFHNAVYYEHMRPNRFPSLAHLMGKKEEFTGPVTNPHGSTTAGLFGSLLRWGYYMLDYTLGFYLKIWPKKAIRSCVWIFDRYYYDYIIDPKRARINSPRWILKFGQFIIPEPDIIICLGTDAQTIHQRKPELPVEEVERQVNSLKKFCIKHKRAIWVDTGTSIEESSNKTLTAITEYMGNRFKNVKLG